MSQQMRTAIRWGVRGGVVWLGMLLGPFGVGAEEEGVAFFETRIRPVLAQECYECHSTATKAKGGLLLDSREGWQKGGDSGEAIVPGKPGASLLLKTIRHEEPDLKMPKAGAKLDAQVIEDIARWIAMGAPDPRDKPPTAQQIAVDTDWNAVAKRRAQWWSFQPIRDPAVPKVDLGFSEHPVDQFVREAQVRAGVKVAPDADVQTVRRRMYYVLSGLPAPVEETAEGGALIEKLLSAPSFGERWARHWMDWFRYSEGHGGQGDPAIENAFEYRDYLIRALNANVPYDQLVREHLAGDLLKKPRVDASGMIHESRIGLAHFRFVEHGYFPVDALDELVKFTDNQIDVVSKATLGLTVSCARCHDHKFDAISQRDYHALFGIFASSRPAQRPLMTEQLLAGQRGELKKERGFLAAALKAQWMGEATLEKVRDRLQGWTKKRAQLEAEKKPGLPALSETDLLYPWAMWREKGDLAQQWVGHQERLKRLREEASAHNDRVTVRRWDFRGGLPSGWYVADGHVAVHGAGELGVGVSDGVVALSVLPAGVSTQEASAFEGAAVASEDVTLTEGALAMRWAGAGGAVARAAVENYPIYGGLLHTQSDSGEDGGSRWFVRGTDFWKGRRGYFHVMTRQTLTAPRGGASRGSWFSLAEVRVLKGAGDVVRAEQFSLAPLMGEREQGVPRSAEELGARYVQGMREVLERWQTPAFSDEDALFLTECLKAGLLSGGVDTLEGAAKEALLALRKREDAFAAVARRSAPGVMESPGFDQALYARGNLLKPGEPVRRAFLSALGGKAYEVKAGSGRLQLAEELTRPDNPLFARVIANRLWHHVFGRGLVSTPDNFGRTGQLPTHPELLDHLASRLIRTGFDLKDNIRYLVSSRTFRLSSQAPEGVAEVDPTNRWLTHALVRRMDAEVIRDHLLAVSGNLDSAMYGPSIPLRTAPEGDRRRGVYVQMKREGQNELFASFDVPVPNTTRGTRDVSVTPGQAMTLMNAPFVRFQAAKWAERVQAGVQRGETTVDGALGRMVGHALTRGIGAEELGALRAYYEERLQAEKQPVRALQQTAHLVFNLKEFIFIP